jgi:hypothetical protein
MKQYHIRFGTSSASDTKDSDHGDNMGPGANLVEDPVLDPDDPSAGFMYQASAM